MRTTELSIAQMSCGHCVERVSTVIEQAPGVRLDTVAVGSGAVSDRAARSGVESMLRPIDASGYPAQTRGAA